MDLKEMGWKRYGLAASGSEQGPVAGSCEYRHEPLGSIKGEQFLD